MHSKDGVRIVYARPASFQIQNVGCVIRVYYGQRNIHQAPVVQTMDSAVHRINHYPVDKH